MSPERFRSITGQYAKLRIAVLGDYCLDRYLEIDSTRKETSIETGLPVYNVVNVRPQPGGAGTIVNNLSALGIGEILPIGFAGADGEGSELSAVLQNVRGVRLDCFVTTRQRRTFTYCKPLIVEKGKPPVELNRLDSKNWTVTPPEVERSLIAGLDKVSNAVDSIIVLDQVDVPDTGVVTGRVLEAIGKFAAAHPKNHVLADSRRGLAGYPPVIFKMNASELSALTGASEEFDIDSTKAAAVKLARKNSRVVFVSLAARGILGADPNGNASHLPALPLRGEIDVVGAGDAVSANLVSALAAGSSLVEALELANAAASVVIHKLGTTGTASVEEIAALLA